MVKLNEQAVDYSNRRFSSEKAQKSQFFWTKYMYNVTDLQLLAQFKAIRPVLKPSLSMYVHVCTIIVALRIDYMSTYV